MSPEGKQTATETTTNDSPAFRLRPRAEPKSYYTIRLEYSANPAAFTRERPRSTKRRSVSSSQKSSYSRSRNQSGGSGGNSRSAAASGAHRYPISQSADSRQLPHVLTKEELEREERRKQLQREIAQSITKDTPMSPFIQRLDLNELKPETTYEHNYITLQVKSIEIGDQTSNNVNSVVSPNSDRKCLNCKCFGVDDGTLSPASPTSQDLATTPSQIYLNVQLYNQYANDKLIKVDKIINVGKFKTGSPILGSSETDAKLDGIKHLGFDVIVNYDDSSSLGRNSGSNNRRRPLIPFISVTDTIEKPIDPYVEMAPSPADSSEVKPVGAIASDNDSLKVNVRAGTIAPPTAHKTPKVELEDVIVDHDSKRPKLGAASATTTSYLSISSTN